MKRILSAGTALIALATCPLLAAAETPDPALQDVIIVTGHRTTTATDTALLPEAAPMDGMDITRLIARTPAQPASAMAKCPARCSIAACSARA